MSTVVAAQEPDSSSALFKMRETERNFARSSVTIGRNAAFAEYFADESAIFTDTWITNGKQASKERKPAPVVLKWEPEFMAISESRDFGISTGPWEAQEYRPNTLPIATGYFLTVWKKQSDGLWKVILDAGSTTPAPKDNLHSFSFPPDSDKPVSNPSRVLNALVSQELLDNENQILTAWQKSPTNLIYFTFLDPDARLQRNGHPPATNRDSINHIISGMDKEIIWKSSGCGVASSGDLGFTYGLIKKSESSTEVKGHYVRIWRKSKDGDWKIIIDMINMN